jgi:hypothetical protein
MTSISTPQQKTSTGITAAAPSSTSFSPRQSTLAFLRQFARAYSPALGGMVLN